MTPGADSGRKNPSKLRGMSSRTGLWMILAFTLGYLGAADRSRADLAHTDHRRRGLSISRAPLPEIPPSLQTTTTTAARRQQTTLSPLKWEARMGSDFSLILENDDLDRAKARMSELRRAELEVQFPHDGKRTRNSKMAKFQRAVAFSNWRQLQGQAPEYLSDQRLADWGNWTTANATGHRHAGQRRE